MRHIALFIVLLLASCSNSSVIIAPPLTKFIITAFAPDGSKSTVHHASQYSESGFPPTIQFRDAHNNLIRVKGSYLIQQQ